MPLYVVGASTTKVSNIPVHDVVRSKKAHYTTALIIMVFEIRYSIVSRPTPFSCSCR